MAFARPLGQAPVGAQRRIAYDAAVTMGGPSKAREGARSGETVLSLAGRGAEYVPDALAMPRVYVELSVKVPRPLPRLYDDGAEDEVIETLLDTVRGARYYQLERNVEARGALRGSSARRMGESLEAICSEGYRDWAEGLTDLQRGLLHHDVDYFLAVHREGSDAVWVFTNQTRLDPDAMDDDDDSPDGFTVSVSAADDVLTAVKETAARARVRCVPRGPHALLLYGYAGVAAGVAVLNTVTAPRPSSHLPLLLSPTSFLGSVCRLSNPRTLTEQTSLFEPPSHFLKLSGRILPHTVAELFSACRALGPFEMDLTPTKATSTWCFADPVPVPWPGGMPYTPGDNRDPDADADDSDADTQVQTARGEAVCPTRAVVTATEVRLSGVPVDPPA